MYYTAERMRKIAQRRRLAIRLSRPFRRLTVELRKRIKLLVPLLVIAVLLFIIWAAREEEKKAWDLIQIFIIPAVLGVGAWWFNRQERKADRENATERQRQATLAAYISQMSDLLLGKDKLRRSRVKSEVRSVARAQTLSTFRILDGQRKGQVLQFLYESDLISENPVINLWGAHLEEANLEDVYLIGASFGKVNLKGANLKDAYLDGIYLSEANLEGANLRSAKLSGALLSMAKLRSAKLSGAHLNGANLRSAKLSGADLEGAFLLGANLEGANLDGANLKGAFLNDADVTPAQLSSAKSLDMAVMPDRTAYEVWVERGKPDWSQGAGEQKAVSEPEKNSSESQDNT